MKILALVPFAFLILLWTGVGLTLCALCLYASRAIPQYRQAGEQNRKAD